MAAPTTGRATFTVSDPRSGEEIGTYPVAGPDDVAAAVDRARGALRWWTDQGYRGRRQWLLEFKRAVAGRSDELADLISAETGKPTEDALLEVFLTVSHLEWAAKKAQSVLRRRSVPAGLVMSNHSASLGYEPYGVVGVIGPWNYPLYTPMGSISYALAAGNTVVFKPSELTPGVAGWLVEVWQSLGAPNDIIQVVTGDGSTGAELCTAGVDKLAFTGSAPTGRKVMAACAESLTPVVIEAGGKDAMIVDRGADIDSAAEQAVFGAMGNAGQTCAGVERVYVVDEAYDDFVAAFTERARGLAPGEEASSSYGPMTMRGQREIIAGHISDALARGGRALLGGESSASDRLVEPVILTDVPEDSTAVTEETFGPTVVINRVADLEEGVDRANATRYGLGASVFTPDKRAGRAAAERLRAGAVAVNAFLAFAAIPALPFGGSGDSGFGRIHGADGLREFSRPKGMTVQRFAPPLNLMSLSRNPRDMKVVRWMLTNVTARF